MILTMQARGEWKRRWGTTIFTCMFATVTVQMCWCFSIAILEILVWSHRLNCRASLDGDLRCLREGSVRHLSVSDISDHHCHIDQNPRERLGLQSSTGTGYPKFLIQSFRLPEGLSTSVTFGTRNSRRYFATCPYLYLFGSMPQNRSFAFIPISYFSTSMILSTH
jgi:hypothetical protein